MIQSASAVCAAGVPRVGGWDFDQLTGLVLWLDGSSINGFEGGVFGWHDKSPAGNDFTAAGATPTHVAPETDFPTPQPAVRFDNSENRMVSAGAFAIRWLCIVAIQPATTFAGYRGLFTATTAAASPSNEGGPFIGNQGTADWYTGNNVGGNIFRNGTDTDVALTTANTPHLYWNTFSADRTFVWQIGRDRDILGRIWGDSVGLVLATNVVPNSTDLANVVARSQQLGLIP